MSGTDKFSRTRRDLLQTAAAARSIGTSNASFILHAERTPTRGSGSQSTLSRLLITARRGLAAYPSFDIGFTVSRGRVSQSTLRHLMP